VHSEELDIKMEVREDLSTFNLATIQDVNMGEKSDNFLPEIVSLKSFNARAKGPNETLKTSPYLVCVVGLEGEVYRAYIRHDELGRNFICPRNICPSDLCFANKTKEDVCRDLQIILAGKRIVVWNNVILDNLKSLGMDPESIGNLDMFYMGEYFKGNSFPSLRTLAWHYYGVETHCKHWDIGRDCFWLLKIYWDVVQNLLQRNESPPANFPKYSPYHQSLPDPEYLVQNKYLRPIRDKTVENN